MAKTAGEAGGYKTSKKPKVVSYPKFTGNVRLDPSQVRDFRTTPDVWMPPKAKKPPTKQMGGKLGKLQRSAAAYKAPKPTPGPAPTSRR